ncbi:MAG: hypothetical protein HZB31_15370 [Nitrospirae bacterium]|nr:hypothetical protein [Nitrospirota bacterium]
MSFSDIYPQIIANYSYYSPILKKLGSFHIGKTVKINDLEVPSGLLHRAYADMKEMDFKGRIIDYFCWVSSANLIAMVKIIVGTGSIAVSDKHEITNLIQNINMIKNKHGDTFNADVNNFIRLSYNNPTMIIELCTKLDYVPIRGSIENHLFSLFHSVEDILIKGTKPKSKKYETLLDELYGHITKFEEISKKLGTYDTFPQQAYDLLRKKAEKYNYSETDVDFIIHEVFKRVGIKMPSIR